MGDPAHEKRTGPLYSSLFPAGQNVAGLDAANQGGEQHIPVHALTSAAALLSREQFHARELEAKERSGGGTSHIPSGPASGVLGAADGLPPHGASTPGHSVSRRLTRRGTPAGGADGADRPASGEPSDGQLVVAPSLLDPHPIIVPPPGSRLAFAGANTARMARIFRALPSLEDTLLRRAQEPLCLFNYWQYLADIEAGSEELEFWLSLADYEALFRKHRRFESPPALSPASMQPAALSPNPATLRLAASAGQRGGRAESGALGISSMRDEASEQLAQSLSQLRGQEAHTFDAETRELDNHLAQLSWQTTKATHSTVCKAHRQCTFAHRPFTAAHASGGPTLDTPAQVARSRGVRGFFARMFTDEPGGRRRDRAVVQKEPLLPHMEHPADDELATVPTEGEMQRAAERLYFHYFLPESPSPLRVSARMRDEVSLRVEREQSFDAEVFVSAKRHAYEAMRYESHMRFLRERLYHNITRGTAAPRIVLGLTLIFVALASQLSLIFLDVKPKAWRWLPIAGLWPGFVYVFAGLSRLDPFMALAARYESTAWALGRVRDKTVRLAHLKRAVLQLAAAAAIAAIISVVMFVVPGHHL